MTYQLQIKKKAEKDISKYVKLGDKKILKKLNILFNELREHPTQGTGKPEKLKHELSGYWSRRIDQKNRLVYRIDNDKVIVLIISAEGHY